MTRYLPKPEGEGWGGIGRGGVGRGGVGRGRVGWGWGVDDETELAPDE